MIIDFKNITPNIVQNMRGGEGSVQLVKYADDVNSVVRITIKKGSSIGWHIHEGDQEIIYVISGKGICIEDDEESKSQRIFSLKICLSHLSQKKLYSFSA